MNYDLTVAYATGRKHHYNLRTREQYRAVKRTVKALSALSGVAVTFTDGAA